MDYLNLQTHCGARFSEDDPGRVVTSIRNFPWSGRLRDDLSEGRLGS